MKNHNNRDFSRSLRLNMTDAEKILWEKLKSDQLGVRFRRQHLIGNYIVDFYCPKLKLAIEIDGGQHCDNQKDDERTQYIQEQGIQIIRFWNNEVLGNIEGVMT